MDRKNRSLDLLLDQREEVILIGLLRAATEGEAAVEELRQQLCECSDFEPYACFKLLQSNPFTSHVLSSHDVAKWLARQYFKNTLLSERNIENVFDNILSSHQSNGKKKSNVPSNCEYNQDTDYPAYPRYAETERLLKYENFLKLVLPREDKGIRGLVMARRRNNDEGEVSREAGYLLIRLLEQEANLHEELTLRKKRLLEYQWREDLMHFTERAFTWLQSQSAIPGVTHVSVLGVCRLLCDVKEVMTTPDVQRMFHRINLSGNDMLSYVEFERFLQCKEATQYLNELYVKYFTTLCPGCGSMCQREGGGCNNVTCGICRTTFRCDTLAKDAPRDPISNPRSYKQVGQSMNNSLQLNSKSIKSGSPSNKRVASPVRLDYSTLNRSVQSVAGNGVSKSAGNSPVNRSGSRSMNFSPKSRVVGNRGKMNETISTTASMMNESKILNESSFMSNQSPRMQNYSTATYTNATNLNHSVREALNDSMRDDDEHLPSRGPNTTFIANSRSKSPQSVKSSVGSPRMGGGPSRTGAGSSFMQSSARDQLNQSQYSQKSPRNNSMNKSMMQQRVANHLAVSNPSAEMKFRRQKASLRLVQDIMYQQIDLDNFIEIEKEALWQQGINIEATFAFLDRYSKNYIADTDIWQIMHNDTTGSGTSGNINSNMSMGSMGGEVGKGNLAVSFAGVCSLFRDIKWRDSKKPGQFNLAEIAQFLFPRQSEEWQQTHPNMSDAEAKSVLYIVRSTVACPGCGARTQRTVEGCPQVTCPCCASVFRCNLIGDDRDQTFKLTLTQKHRVRQYLKVAVDAAEEQERLRKALAVNGYTGDSLSSILLDAFLLIAQDKGYCTFGDFKKILLQDKPSLRFKDLELLWFRYARDKKRIGFVEFASQLRPFGVS